MSRALAAFVVAGPRPCAAQARSTRRVSAPGAVRSLRAPLAPPSAPAPAASPSLQARTPAPEARRSTADGVLDKRTARVYLEQLEGWELRDDAEGRQYLERTWLARTFSEALALYQQLRASAAAAAASAPRPPSVRLHLLDARCMAIRVAAGAPGGLTESDVLAAAKLHRVFQRAAPAQALF